MDEQLSATSRIINEIQLFASFSVPLNNFYIVNIILSQNSSELHLIEISLSDSSNSSIPSGIWLRSIVPENELFLKVQFD